MTFRFTFNGVIVPANSPTFFKNNCNMENSKRFFYHYNRNFNKLSILAWKDGDA